MAKQKKPRLTKEATDAFFSAKQAEAKARREKKLTGDDISTMIDERKQRRLPRSPEAKQRSISIGIGAALLVGTGAVMIGSFLGSDSFTVETEQNTSRISDLTHEIQVALPVEDLSQVDDYRKLLDAQIKKATEQGEQIAALQQEFLTIFAEANNDESPGNGGASSEIVRSLDNRRALAPFFTELAKPVEGEVAYAPGSSNPLGESEIDARFPWYQPTALVNGRIVYASADVCTWDLVSVVATETAGVFDATWLCQDSSGDLYSWATASWFAEREVFGRLLVGETTIGGRAAGESEGTRA